MTLKNNSTAETNAQPVLTHTVSLTHELVLSDKSLGLTKQQQQAIKSVLKAYALAAKNIKNSTLFIIKNLQSAYQYATNEAYQDMVKNKVNADNLSKLNQSEKKEEIPKGFYHLKSKLHDNQQQLIDLANQAIMELNQEQLNKFEKNKTKKKTDKLKGKTQNKNKEPKIYQSFVNTISISAYGQTFNKTLVERIIKLKEQANPKYVDYSEVHSHLAQGVLQKVCDDFSHYIKSLVAYQEKLKEFTGRPQAPQYLGKHDGATFEFHALRWPNNGHFLNVMKHHKLYHDFNKKNKVSPEEIAMYNQIDFKALIDKSIQTCFINNEVMKVKANKHLNKEIKQKENQTTVVQQKAVSGTMDNQDVSHKVDMSRGQWPHHNSRPKQTALSGKRNSTVYTTAHFSRQEGDSQINVHADVHGSLNIDRKFISRLNFDYLGHNMSVFKVKRLANQIK